MIRRTFHLSLVLIASGLGGAYGQSPPIQNELSLKIVDDDGRTVGELLNQFKADAKNHGQYVSRVAHAANDLYKRGVISESERQQLKQSAAHSSVGK